MLKFIYKFFIICSAFISILSIGIISLCIIVMSNKSITIKDENKYISSLISWYFNNEVSFDEIQINNKSMNKTYEINIKNIFVDKFNAYKNLKIKNLSLNMKPINLFNEFQKFNILIVDNLSVDYLDNYEFDSNLSIKFKDSILNISDLISLIYNSSFVISNDTGPAHICTHLNKKGLVLFGEHTSPEKVSIESDNFKSIKANTLKELNVADVFEKVKENLN